MMFLAMGFFFGVVVATYFRVWALIPLTIATIAAFTFGRLVSDSAANWTFGSFVVEIFAQQLGFGFGLLTRHFDGIWQKSAGGISASNPASRH